MSKKYDNVVALAKAARSGKKWDAVFNNAVGASCGSGSVTDLEEIYSTVVNNGKDTLLILAARHGQAHVVGSLLQLSPYNTCCQYPSHHFHAQPRKFLEYKNKVGHCALHEAALSGVAETVNLLLRASAEVDAIKHADWTPLQLACTTHSLNVVDHLLEGNASVHHKNKDGWNALHVASRTGCPDIVHRLLQTSTRCCRDVSNNGRIPLMTAALHRHVQVVELLLGDNQRISSSPTDVTTGGRTCVNALTHRDTCGQTALLAAVIGGSIRIIRSLAEAGANVHDVDDNGMGALHHISRFVLCCHRDCAYFTDLIDIIPIFVSVINSRETHRMLVEMWNTRSICGRGNNQKDTLGSCV
eukprot:m.238952 g.238952  ORF g.238952 m.238952 type:complete len:357 (+) comp19404_c0_seq1:198-1268(+)